jgi:hypothetical protein
MKGSAEFKDFAKLVERLSSCYPSARPRDIGRIARDWFPLFSKYSKEIIDEAMQNVINVSAIWFPSAGAVVSECKRLTARRAREREDSAKLQRDKEEDMTYQEHLKSVPSAAAARSAWVNEAEDGYERMGREWAISSADGRAMTVDEAKARVASILKALG